MSDRSRTSPSGPRLIKRYANRKLYDTTSSRYVTLPQIAELVRDGEDVQIIDNTSKENLTEVTLAQIVFEEQKHGRGGGPGRGTLQDLIRKSSERLVSQSREVLDELQGLAEERVRGVLLTALGHVEQLQGEVGRLHDRIEDLEARLARRPRRDSDEPRGEPPADAGPTPGESPGVAGQAAPAPEGEAGEPPEVTPN